MVSDKLRAALNGVWAYLLDTGRVCLDEHAEPTESRVLLVVVLDLPESGAPAYSVGLVMVDLANARRLTRPWQSEQGEGQ
jgi:hypothetical protein